MKRFLTVAVCAAAMVAMCACGGTGPVAEKYDLSLAASVSVKGERVGVSPLIYGQFIEHIETCIYDGIWSEKVLDRKFYYEVGESGLSPWTGTGAVTSDAQTTLSGGHAASIAQGGQISQKGLSVSAAEYTGYFWCKSSSGCTVNISLSKGIETVSAKVEVPANSDFKKFEYALNSGFKTTDAVYTLSVGKGEGLFDSLSLMPADNIHGMRKDTLDKLKELDAPLYRWPGGNFLSGYDWEDGVGDIDKRPSRRNLHYMGLESDFMDEDSRIASDIVKLRYLGFYGGIEPNDYGLDEFLYMCDYLGAEPLMMVNDGLGTKEEAAAQVEYCNGSVNTRYGRMRADNGHAEPYKIRYWGIGNEMFGNWQLGNVPISQYTVRHNEFADAMRAIDGSILITAVGNNASSWSDEMFENCGDRMDTIAEHMYALQDNTDVYTHLSNMRSNLQGRIANHRRLQERYPAYKDVKIAFTEYAYSEATSASRLKDGMGIGIFLNEVIRNADVFELCCYSSTVNATQGCVTTEPFGAVLQGSGYVLMLYRKYMQENFIPGGVRWDDDLQVDAVFTVSDDGKTVSVGVVNPSDKAVRLTNPLFGQGKISRISLTGDYYDSYNSTNRDEMYLTEAKRAKEVVAPAMSVSVFTIEL